MGPEQDGLQQRSEWPRILHSAVHAHSPGKEKEFPEVSTHYASTCRMPARVRAAEEEGAFKNRKAHTCYKDNFM